MGLLDIFKRRKKKDNVYFEEKDNQLPVEDIMDENVETKTLLNNDTIKDVYDEIIDEYTYSKIIPNETIEKIKQINNIEYIGEIMIKRMEKYPELIDILLKGNISENVLILLNEDVLDYLPFEIDDLKYIKFLDFDEKTKNLALLLNNLINFNLVNDDYISFYFNLSEEFETIHFQNEIESFIPNIKINLGNKLLTKTDCYSRFILHLPKSKYKQVYHDFTQYIDGNIELDEDVIVQMDYASYRCLDKAIVDKISKCKIVLSENTLTTNFDYNDDEINYRLLKYNHLIYIVENSSLDEEIKQKLCYKIKNLYKEDLCFYDLSVYDSITTFLQKIDFEEIERLTKEFESNIDTYKTKEIKSPEFNASYYIDDHFPNFNNINLQDFIDCIDILPEDLKIMVLREPRVLSNFDLSEDIDELTLRRISFILSQRLSKTTINFINSIGLDVESFMTNEKNNYQSSYDINPIVAKYGIFDFIEKETVISIADLVGHDHLDKSRYNGTNILHTFKEFFDEKGDGYHTRALSLLEYKTGSQLLEALEKRNNDTKDMNVILVENGKYVISSNGLHRFTILRFHYLLDCMKNEKSEEELRELYQIPVNMQGITNFKKTYCNYIIQKANPEIIRVYFDSSKDEITFLYKSYDISEKINEEKLFSIIKECVDKLDSSALSEILYFYNTYSSFHEFVDKYVPELLGKMEIENKGMIQK